MCEFGNGQKGEKKKCMIRSFCPKVHNKVGETDEERMGNSTTRHRREVRLIGRQYDSEKCCPSRELTLNTINKDYNIEEGTNLHPPRYIATHPLRKQMH